MIEILQFALSTNLGGIETYLKKIWDNIDREKYHFSFIDMTGENRTPCYYDYFIKTGCTFYKITPRNISIVQNRKDFERLFEEHKFDVLHFSVNTLSYLLPVSIAIKNGVKVIVHSRCAGLSGRSITKMLHFINKYRLNHMTVERIAVSEQAGKWMFDLPYKVYPNGVDTQRFKYSTKYRNKTRKELDCQDSIVIGHVGTFTQTKNHVLIINVFENFHKRHIDSVLWLVGDGPLKNNIKDMVNDRGLLNSVRFLGRREDVETLYSGMDLFLFPSFKEGLGNVVLEAESEGLPCLVSDSIPQEILVDDNSKALSLNDPIEKWTNAIEELLSINNRREEGYKTIHDAGWSVKEEVLRLQCLYSSILQ